MKIIILGSGQVGGTLAEYFLAENNDITVIDDSIKQITLLQERLDIRAIFGNASYPNLLNLAGAAEADMLIAATNNDEVNIVACQIAHHIFKIPTKIARIHSLQYLAHPELFTESCIPIDAVISPEQLVTNHIKLLIEYPDALQVLDFANKQVQLVAVKAYYGGALVGHALKALQQFVPNAQVKVGAIFRKNKALHFTDNTLIESGDEVFFLTAKQYVREIMACLRNLEATNHRIIIAGGGNIGTRLALSLEANYSVKVIEHNKKHIEELAAQLTTAIVLEGEAADRELLMTEDIRNTDVFCAVTNSDEANILSALLAKRMGVKKAIALVNSSAYIDVIEESDIDIAVSPIQAVVSSLLTYFRHGDIVNVYSLRRGAAEAIEAIAHGRKETSPLVGRTIAEITMPEGASIVAVVRNGIILMDSNTTTIQEYDHLIFFLADRRKIAEVERLLETK